MTQSQPLFPPVDPTRRRFLAAHPAPSVANALAALPASQDPVFNLIEDHQKANAAHWAAIDEQNRLEKLGEPEADSVAAAACRADNVAFVALMETEPTTFAGLVALLTYLNEIAEEGGAWRFEGEDSRIVSLLANLAASVRRLVVAS